MSQYDKNSIEDLGLLKIDLINSLSLSMLSDIADILKNSRNINLSFSEIKHDDKKVFNLIKNGRTLGVFQLESFGIRTLARKIKPSSLNDITLLISLYRPGPQQSGMVNNFIERKFGRERITYLNKDLKPILEETYGIILYQEQVMQIAIKIAGYSLSESENLRKAMTGRSKEEMKTQESRFVRGALKKGCNRGTVNKIFKLISKFASYGFVKAHAAAYAELSYKTCYLKAYYPAELISIILTNKSGYYNEMQYIEEARRLGIGIKLPDINRSGIEFCVEDGGKSIRTSLLSIRNLGFEGVNFIINERARNGNFKDFFDFYYRTSNNHRLARKAVENLIKIGAFDFTNLKRKYLLLIFYHLQNLNNNSARHSHNSYFHNNSCLQNQNPKNLIDFTLEEKLKLEEEILGFFISANPLKYFKEELKKFNITRSKYFSYLIKNRKKEYRISGLIKNANYIYPKDIFTSGIVITRRIEKTKNGQPMLFCTMEDEDGMYESVFFSDTFKRNSKIIMNQSPVIIKGRLHLRDNTISIIAKDVISLVLLKKLENNSIRDNIKTNLLAGAGAIWKT
jgi:DNA polymerase-3 subunit alpha